MYFRHFEFIIILKKMLFLFSTKSGRL